MKDYSEKRLLITGASGLLGLNLALEYANEFQVIGIVNNHLLKEACFQVVQTDLLEEGAVEQVFSRYQPDWVLHCAALADIGLCERNPDRAEELNVRLPGIIARNAHANAARLIHISTDAVFDGQEGGYREDSQTNPINVYAKTKLAGEREVFECYPEALVVRLNLFGWSRSGKRSLAEFFFNNLAHQREVFGFTDVFFTPLLANDLADLFLPMLDSETKGLFHLGSPEKISKYQFGLEIAQRFGFSEELIHPVLMEEAKIKASRGKDLSLLTDKFESSFSASIPELSTGLNRFFGLYQQGYPQKLQDLSRKAV